MRTWLFFLVILILLGAKSARVDLEASDFSKDGLSHLDTIEGILHPERRSCDQYGVEPLAIAQTEEFCAHAYQTICGPGKGGEAEKNRDSSIADVYERARASALFRVSSAIRGCAKH